MTARELLDSLGRRAGALPVRYGGDCFRLELTALRQLLEAGTPKQRLEVMRDRTQGDAAEQLLELAREVRRVLDTQREYFASRSTSDLQRSKRLEAELRRRVDAILRPPLTFSGG